mgnify:FL=1
MSNSIQAAHNGDAFATIAVVSSLRPRIASMARHYGKSCGEDPDDLQQEAWLGLLEGLQCVDCSIGSPEQYLLKRARWRILDTIKRERVRRHSKLADATEDNLSPQAFKDLEANDLVASFLKKLTKIQQDIFVCLLAGLTWREAGSRLGFTSANVAYHMRSIRQRFKSWQSQAGLVSPGL